MNRKQSKLLQFEGCNFLRHRIVLSTLSGKPIKITNIHSNEENTGLQDYEINFIRLIDKISNGCKIMINETGTEVVYHPGALHGGKLDHDCNKQRGIGYYLEPLMILAPFCKNMLKITLRGVTNDQVDPSVDILKTSVLPVMKRFILNNEDLNITISKRGAPPLGGGEVVFICPVCKNLYPLQMINYSKIKKIRGTAYTMRIAPTLANRLVESAKGLLLNFIPDIYIYTDHYKGNHAGKSPGFGLVLSAETVDGHIFAAEAMSNPSGSPAGPSVAEDIGKEAAHKLLEEIFRGGCIDSTAQSLAFIFMAFGSTDIFKLLTGPLSPYSMECLRLIKKFIGVTFKLDPWKLPEDEGDLSLGSMKILAVCLGSGYYNLNKTMR